MDPEGKSDRGYCTLSISRWNLAAVRAAHPEFEDSPVAIVSSGRILEASPGAERMGITVGMSTREAHSRLPSLVLVEQDEELSRRAFTPILKAIFEVTPFVQIERVGYLHFPLDGLLRYYKSLRILAERVLESLPSSSVLVPRGDTVPAVGLGIGPTRFTSLMAASRAARLSESSSVLTLGNGPPSTKDSASSWAKNGAVSISLAHYLSPPAGWMVFDLETPPASLVGQFPIEVLKYVLEPEDPHDMDVWHLLGIHTLGDLAALDPGLLADRFGQWAVNAWILANGQDPEVLLPARPPLEMEESWEFDPPAFSMDSLLFASAQLATRLDQKLKAQARECRYLRLEVVEESSRVAAVAWRVRSSISASIQRCRWHLEAMAVSSPIRELRLVPQNLISLRGTQLCLEGLSCTSPSNTREWEVIEKALDRTSWILEEEAAYFVEVVTPGASKGHLPHEDAVFVSRSLCEASKQKASFKSGLRSRGRFRTLFSSTDSSKEGTRLDIGGREGSQGDSLSSTSSCIPGAFPLPYPALVVQVEESRDGVEDNRESSVSEIAFESQQGKGVFLRSPGIPGDRSSKLPELLALKRASRVTAVHFQKEPLVVRKGPRITDPPQSVDGHPVVSAAGPWSYLLKWWDDQHSFCGEVWQVVLEDPQNQSAMIIFRAEDGLWYLYAIYD
ncbi:MAG: hypothetical protein C4319_00120 [Acidimicrobiia bacterium]